MYATSNPVRVAQFMCGSAAGDALCSSSRSAKRWCAAPPSSRSATSKRSAQNISVDALGPCLGPDQGCEHHGGGATDPARHCEVRQLRGAAGDAPAHRDDRLRQGRSPSQQLLAAIVESGLLPRTGVRGHPGPRDRHPLHQGHAAALGQGGLRLAHACCANPTSCPRARSWTTC